MNNQQTHSNKQNKAMHKITRLGLVLSLALSMFGLAGCNTGADDVIQVQTNLVDKSIFEGEWWMNQTVLDSDAAATAYTGTFRGDSFFTDLGIDKGWFGAVARIRWVIDEDFLFAYRAYELIDGGNDDGRDADFRGQPLAAFAIENHIDIRRSYNGLTGEVTNVTVENTMDRRWYERDFMRVDWSMNHVQSFSLLMDTMDLYGGSRRESQHFLIQEDGAHSDFPAHYAPQFVRVGEDPNYRLGDEWPGSMSDSVHYMSFTTQTMVSPGVNCLFLGGGPCQTYSFPTRNAFLRVPPNHTYAVGTQTYDEYDRFGVFRSLQRTYVRGGQATDTLRRHCTEDEDCGLGAFCDLGRNICNGGLTEDYGETDFLAFYRPRHNFFQSSLTDTECRADWECNGQYEDTPGTPGSECDRAARRCTIPLQDREIRPVRYHLTDNYPPYLVKSAYQVIGDWNEVFMEGWRSTQNREVPDYSVATVTCQEDDPTTYCFCGSADDVGGTCAGKYDPFISPDEFRAQGVRMPYDCQIVNDAFTEPTNPQSYDDYTMPDVYQYEFRGEECMMLLITNSCDLQRTSKDQTCDELVPDGKWEQPGDLRYQYFSYVDQVYTPFGGLSELRADPATGELITADANFAANVTRAGSLLGNTWFPALRCVGDPGCAPGEEGADEEWLTGENLREYYDRAGTTEHPVGIAASGSDGFTTEDGSRPAIPVDISGRLNEMIHRAMPRIERLRGVEGRANILSDRMRELEGTEVESRLLGAVEREVMQAHFKANEADMTNVAASARINDDAIMNQVSPFRGNGFIDHLLQGDREKERLGNHNACFHDIEAGMYRRRYMEYFAEAFRGRSASEASIRMQQLYARNVQYHEMGHSVGLRHNFGGTFDRNHYGNGYFNQVADGDLALPQLEDYDSPTLDGNADGFVGGGEVNRFLADLREVRNERSARGIYNYTSSSTMDYAGDMSDVQGLGRYDKAATVWNYFDRVEAYVGDPRVSSGDSLDGLTLSHTTDRQWMRIYNGGESCDEDIQCPYADTGSNPSLATYGEDGLTQPVTQRCIRNPRYTRLPEPCGGDRNCVCSNFDEDFRDYVDGVAYDSDRDGDRELDFWPTRYLFCSDSRTADISWCNRFDAGESFQEAIDHFRRSWEESYPSTYNRRFYRSGPRTLASYGSVVSAAKIYQHLFFRLFFEPGFSSNDGPLGFNDQFFASVDAMNWFTELVNLPDIGSYRGEDRDGDGTADVYVHMGEDTDMTGADFSLPMGQGYGMWTQYQEGHQGFFRAERAGVFYDKYFALLALALRDWGLSFGADERYFINFYDLFDVEMTEFFGGMVLNDESWFAPRVDVSGADPVVQNLSWYRGVTLGECNVGGARVPCRGDQATVYPGPTISDTSNEILRTWATVLALAQFPVFYDTSFEQRLIIFKLDSGGGHDIPDTQPDGSPTMAYGDGSLLGHGTAADPEDAQYVIYESDRFHTPYIAVRVEPSIEFNLEEQQLGFQLLRRLVDLQAERNAMPPGAARDEVSRRLTQNESFLELLIDLQARYGISNSFF